MYGYGARGSNVSAGVHDPIFAKAIVLSDGTKKLAVVTLDLGSMRRESTLNIRKLVQHATDIDTVLQDGDLVHALYLEENRDRVERIFENGPEES